MMEDSRSLERGNRCAINKILSLVGNDDDNFIGIYTATTSDNVPRGALMVNVDSTEISIATGCNNGDNKGNSEMIVKGYQSGNMVDMIRLKTHLNKTKPDSIFFLNVTPESVWVIFQFYNELLCQGDENAKGSVTDSMRTSKADFKLDDNYELYSLGAALGANIFLDAMQTEEDTLPEVSMTKTLIERKKEFGASKVPYLVLARSDDDYVLPVLPTVTIDGKDGSIRTHEPTFSLKKMFKTRSHDSIIAKIPEVKFMFWATYVNLSHLYDRMKNPSMVIFKNVEPSAVLGMINFYDKIVDPDMCMNALVNLSCADNIYIAIPDLKKKRLANISKQWNLLAKWSGAQQFETIVRHNL